MQSFIVKILVLKSRQFQEYTFYSLQLWSGSRLTHQKILYLQTLTLIITTHRNVHCIPILFAFYALSTCAVGNCTTSVPSWYAVATRTSQKQTAEKLPGNKKMRFIRRLLALSHFQVLEYLLSVKNFSLSICNSSLLCPDSRTHLPSLQIMGEAQCHAERCGTREDC